jgi:dihydroorotase
MPDASDTAAAPDLLIRGGRVLDPASGVDAALDAVVRGGLISALVEPGTAPAGALRVIDATGRLVVPGLIDMHAHVFEGSPFGLDPAVNLRGGVTTVVDAGSAGFATFEEFRRHAIAESPVRIVPFLHIAAAGLGSTFVGELEDIRHARVDEAIQLIDECGDLIAGVKVRTGTRPAGANSEAALTAALAVAEATGRRLMAHIGLGSDVSAVVARLRPGDVVTHCFTGGGDAVLDPATGRVAASVCDARDRGVLFDVGHGCGSFSWSVARRALADGFPPDTSGTDLSRLSVVTPVVDLPTTMSKLLHLGMSLPEVIATATSTPARGLGRSDDLGTLAVGRPADVGVLRLDERPTPLRDAFDVTETAAARLSAEWTIVAGRPYAADVAIDLRPLYETDRRAGCGGPIE